MGRVPKGGAAGQLTVLELARLSGDQHRRAARRRRRRDRAFGWCFAVILLGGFGGAGYAGYVAFQDDDEFAASRDGGVAGALGGAIDSVDGLHRRTLSNGMPVTAELSLVEVSVGDVLPEFVRGFARSVGADAGLERYAVNVDDLADLEPELTADWLAVLSALPQSSVADAPLPAPGNGELLVGIDADGDAVRRLVVRSTMPSLSIDTTS